MRIEPGTNRMRAAARRVNPCVPLLGLIAVFCLVLSLALAADPQAGNSIKGFRAPLQYCDPPHELQVKSYLEGSESEFLSNGLIGLKNAKLRTYNDDGSEAMVAMTPECIYDTHAQTVSSTGLLQVQTVDPESGTRIWHEGVGFFWVQTNSDLKISNQVSTIITGTPTNLFNP